MQHAELGSGHQRLLGLTSPLAGVIEAEINQGIQARVSGPQAKDQTARRVAHLAAVCLRFLTAPARHIF